MDDKYADVRSAADLAWSDFAAACSVDELLVAEILSPADADFARRIVAQQLHILLVSGKRP